MYPAPTRMCVCVGGKGIQGSRLETTCCIFYNLLFADHIKRLEFKGFSDISKVTVNEQQNWILIKVFQISQQLLMIKENSTAMGYQYWSQL